MTSLRTAGLFVLAAVLCIVAALGVGPPGAAAGPGAAASDPSTPSAPTPVPRPFVDAPSPSNAKAESRAAAQRGLTYLAKSAVAWQAQHECYGCHVQAVTLEALAVGQKHGYDVASDDLASIRDGMLTLLGGQRGPGGLSLRGSSLFADAKTFGGMAFARYDELVDATLAADLLDVARALVEFQQSDGSFRLDDGGHPPPVKAGPMQGTLHAMQTWRQAYARSADEAWLAPIRKAEAYIQRTVAGWGDPMTHDDLQDLDYALMGLAAAGASRDEVVTSRLVDRIIALQHDDGGFGFGSTNRSRAGPLRGAWPGGQSEGGTDPSNAFATGQALYALRTVGLTERHPAVARATRWLVEHQRDAGGWSTLGSSKAEAMWAVLGLVGVDVVTIDVEGVVHGSRLDTDTTVRVHAKANEAGGVRSLDLYVDDRRQASRASDRLTDRLRPAGLEDGRHVVEVVATLEDGRTGRRRFEIFTGEIFLSDLATRYSDGGTLISARSIARASDGGHAVLTLHRLAAGDGPPRAGPVVREFERPATQGALAFHWNDDTLAGERLFAVLRYRDPKGRVRQTERLLFYHGRAADQRRRFGEVSGELRFGRTNRATTNSVVELVDDAGRVVQTTRTTKAGNYRFKNVGGGRYRVRLRKKGYQAQERQVEARAGQDAKAKMTAW